MRNHYIAQDNKPASKKNEFCGFKAPNCTYTPNEWYDEIAPTITTRGALLVMGVIFRQTLGWHKEWDRISLTQLIKKTGLTRQSVISAVKYLINRSLINRVVEGPNGEQQTWYRLNICEESDFSSKKGLFSNNCDQSNLHTPPSLIIRPTKETKQNKYKNKEDEAKQKPPPPASVPPFFNKKTKEQHFELTNEERKKLQDRLGVDLPKYEIKRDKHLKKCPNSSCHKRRAYDVILEWYTKDQKEKAEQKQARDLGKTQATLKREIKGKQLVTDVLIENPRHGHVIEPHKDCVELGLYSPATGRPIVRYDDPELYRKIENMLHKIKEYEGLDFKMPLTEKEYLE